MQLTKEYIKTLSKEDLQIYTDGSYNKDTHSAGAGVTFLIKDKILLQAYQPLGHNTNNFAEIYAVGMALTLIKQLQIPYTRTHIFSDSIYTINTLTLKHSTKVHINLKLIHIVRNMLKILNRNTPIIFHWTPSHKGIQGNTLADKLANQATQIPDQQNIYTHHSHSKQYTPLTTTTYNNSW